MDFLRSKQAGVHADFTGSLLQSDLFILDEVAKCGLDSTISTLAYDPVQSLLAVGTNDNATSPGTVHVFGQKRVHVKFMLERKSSVRFLRLCDSKIVVVTSKNELTIFDMEAPAVPGMSYSPPGVVTALLTDPSLDWAFLGLQNGEVLAYDIDREALSPFRLPNFWRERSPKARLLPVVSMAMHPKDVGKLLIGYTEGAVVYSIKQNVTQHYLYFELPPGAPGADLDSSMMGMLRKPALTQVLWHPTGTFVCTTYEDSCMVIWDPKDGRIVESRTLQEAGVHVPKVNPRASSITDSGGTISIRQPLFKVAWCSTSNPDDTSLLIAGGNSMSMPAKGMTLLDLGPTPNTYTSSYAIISEHFASPRRQRILPTPADLDVIDFCLIPRTSPHYAGAHDPVAIIALLSSGELTTLRFPDRHPLSPASLLHPSLLLSHPNVTRVDIAAVNRQRWLGMEESRDKAKQFIVGGIEDPKPLRRYENRTVVQTSHNNGTVRIWDVGHADEIENGNIMELDLIRPLQRGVDLKVEHVSMSGATGETAVGMETGEVICYGWGRNRAFGRTPEDEAMHSTPSQPEGTIRDVKMKADPDLKEGLLPLFVLQQHCGSVVALKMSDIGFVAIAHQTGHLTVVDMRGPAIIFHEGLNAVSKLERRQSFRKSRDMPQEGEKASCLEFGILTLEGDEFSSIVLFVGTTLGRLLTFKILPQPKGGFTCGPAGSTRADGQVVSITPLNADSGKRAWATQMAMSNLREGIKVPGILVLVTSSEAKIFKPPGAKGAHKSWDDYNCVSAAVAELEDYGITLSCVMDSGAVKCYSLPGLKEIANINVKGVFDPSRLADTRIMGTGHILGWTAPTEFMLVYMWGKGQKLEKMRPDTLYNPNMPVPARPTISNIQWLSGTQHVTAADVDLLIGGPDRPMSRKMLAQAREEQNQARLDERDRRNLASASPGRADEGVFAGMTRSFQERTEKLNFVGDSMDRLGDSSQSFADDVSKFVSQQKRNVLLGGLKSKFF